VIEIAVGSFGIGGPYMGLGQSKQYRSVPQLQTSFIHFPIAPFEKQEE
jgi:hypothetical protein